MNINDAPADDDDDRYNDGIDVVLGWRSWK
jgi:hypothetical protein